MITVFWGRDPGNQRNAREKCDFEPSKTQLDRTHQSVIIGVLDAHRNPFTDAQRRQLFAQKIKVADLAGRQIPPFLENVLQCPLCKLLAGSPDN
jgi:hypothetical protein